MSGLVGVWEGELVENLWMMTEGLDALLIRWVDTWMDDLNVAQRLYKLINNIKINIDNFNCSAWL